MSPIKSNSLILFFYLTGLSLISSQQSSMTVEGIDTSAIIMTTTNIMNPTIIEMATGNTNGFHTHYYIRNQSDLWSIDVKSDLLSGGSARRPSSSIENHQEGKSLKSHNPDSREIVTVDAEGTIRATGNIRPGFSASGTGQGSIRYNPSNAHLEVFTNGKWKNLSCQAFNLISTNFNEAFNYSISAGQASIQLEFNTPVDPTSVILGTTFLPTDYADNPISGTITWNYNHTKMRFRSAPNFDDTCQPGNTGCLKITLVGSDSTSLGIMSKSGCSLDGDGDGFESGNYSIQYLRLV